MNKMIKIIKAVYIKNRRTTQRAYPYSFMISRTLGAIISIVADLMIYYLVFQKELSDEFLLDTGTNDYIAYVVLGQALSILSFATLMNVGRCLINEIREGTIDNFILSPASRIGYFLGAYLEQFGRAILEAVSVLAVGFVLGMRISLERIPSCAVVLLISSLAFFSVALFVSTIMIYTRDTYLVQNTFFLGMEFLCGVLYPITFMPTIFQYIAKLLPLTHVLTIFRNCVIDGESISNNANLIAIVILLSILYAVVGFVFYIKIERKLIEEVLA